MVKAELFTKFLSDEGKKIDSTIRDQIISCLREMKGFIDSKFYGIESLIETLPEPTTEKP